MVTRPEPTAPAGYDERLRVPLLWWVLAAGFVGSVWLAYAAAVSPPAAVAVAAAIAAVLAALLAGYGHVRVAVTSTSFVAGRARLPLWAVGGVDALDGDAVRRARGPDADVRAYLVVRAYARGAVKVTVDDPDDPVPYWLVSTRHPRRLAAALDAARGRLPRAG